MLLFSFLGETRSVSLIEASYNLAALRLKENQLVDLYRFRGSILAQWE
jgi:hypothetical protein